MLSTTELIAIPVISGLIGWFTNFLAVKMLFRPRRPWRFLGLRWQGLVPQRQSEIAQSIGEIVSRELLSHDDLRQALQHDQLHSALSGRIEEQLDIFMREKLSSFGMVAMFMQGEMFTGIRVALVSHLREQIPHLLGEVGQRLEQQIDFREVVTKKVAAFDLDKLEQVIHSIARRELRTIEYLGGVLGFLIGIVQVLIIQW
jgi:uncharacterized membrane protein YheB (UPF0754 family)